ncbi:CAZyme family AA7 [Penicillium angulare]|uniref:CAZyme family AA7 n=1 Tax=Penicillium angulare TaxID=116970 RepID=UPI00254223EF|nr:CAZyme family AA7 [Penicillium angulare]KAJ5263160.1 CAZyme family AA7 [Penicillium angulare]
MPGTLAGRLKENGTPSTAVYLKISVAQYLSLRAVITTLPTTTLQHVKKSRRPARTNVYGAATGLNWEANGDKTCALNIFQNPSVLSDECYLGRLSSLYVDAHKAEHVITAIKFARLHNLRVSIKNTGHDYFGRSTSSQTLAIWIHNLKSMRYYANFTAHDCSAANGQNIGEMGAGAQAADLYKYFQKFDMDVTGGNEGSVGLAGGFGQGGGHGVFGPSYGLMVDNAVEFDIVTADGELRTINKCQDPDLFWAMRGGGGGTFGILINYRFQLHPAVKINVYSTKTTFVSDSNHAVTSNYSVLRGILTQHATYQLLWSRNNISGHVYYWPNRAEIYLVLPSNDETALKSLANNFSSFLMNQQDINVTERTYTTYNRYTDYLNLTEAIAAVVTPGGYFGTYASRLMSRSLFESEHSVTKLVDAVLKGVRLGNNLISKDFAVTQVIMTTPVNHQNGNQTSVNPAWRPALWHLLLTGGWTKKLSDSTKQTLIQKWLDTVKPVKTLTPGGGCYLNEGHYLEPEWQETFFGSNYPELLRIKKKYDPTHFFDCYKRVGWEQTSVGVNCLTELPSWKT